MSETSPSERIEALVATLEQELRKRLREANNDLSSLQKQHTMLLTEHAALEERYQELDRAARAAIRKLDLLMANERSAVLEVR